MDKQIQTQLSDYVFSRLQLRDDMQDYIPRATILCSEFDPEITFDWLILLDNDLFRYEYERLYSGIVDDHDHFPPVFTKVRPYQWLMILQSATFFYYLVMIK